jgi:hypothetical protein
VRVLLDPAVEGVRREVSLGRALTIDHIAVPRSWEVQAAQLHPAVAEGARLSDHDAYVVDVTRV